MEVQSRLVELDEQDDNPTIVTVRDVHTKARIRLINTLPVLQFGFFDR